MWKQSVDAAANKSTVEDGIQVLLPVVTWTGVAIFASGLPLGVVGKIEIQRDHVRRVQRPDEVIHHLSVLKISSGKRSLNLFEAGLRHCEFPFLVSRYSRWERTV